MSGGGQAPALPDDGMLSTIKSFLYGPFVLRGESGAQAMAEDRDAAITMTSRMAGRAALQLS